MIIRKNVPNSIKKLIDSNIANHIVFTKFINYDSSNFYKILNYKDCMNEKDRNIVIDTKDYKIIEKRVYTAYNDELKLYINTNNIKTIYLCGIDTDACVLKTALDLFENNFDVKVIDDFFYNYCSGEDVEAFIQSLAVVDKKTIEMIQQMSIVNQNTEEVSSSIKR